jgi:F420 biosynthesis protein FbiB-like protein
MFRKMPPGPAGPARFQHSGAGALNVRLPPTEQVMEGRTTGECILGAIEARRSVRHFEARPVPRALIERAVALACLAPAPHHTRPWRFVLVSPGEPRRRLAGAMEAAWAADMTADGVPPAQQTRALERSRRRVVDAPALLLGCLVRDGLREWPDEARQRAEWGMAQQSFGAAVENLLLAAHGQGLTGYWLSAPLYCPAEVRSGLALPVELHPQALVALGFPNPDFTPVPRVSPVGQSFLVER